MEKDRKLQIIKAAVKRFDKHGLNKTTLNEIARDLRIGKATIYGYFKSKEELYFAALDWEGSLYLDDIRFIFNNEELSIDDQFLDYFEIKNSLPVKYKLIQDTVIQIISENFFEKEKVFFDKILAEEELILNEALLKLNSSKNIKIEQSVSFDLVVQTWGNFLGKKLALSTNPSLEFDTKNLFKQLIDLK